MFRKSKKSLYIKIEKNGTIIYQGRWYDLPLGEDTILQKSIAFFNDPTPCYIHREAVRVRLIAEMETALQGCYHSLPSDWLQLLSLNLGQNVDQVLFYEE